jgi:hypothetical protein
LVPPKAGPSDARSDRRVAGAVRAGREGGAGAATENREGLPRHQLMTENRFMKHQGVSVEEELPGLWRWIIYPQQGPKVAGDAKHRSREAAVASAIEEINNGLERSRTMPRGP